jgi:hypothetical protein
VWTAVVVVSPSRLLPVLAAAIGPGRAQSVPVFLTNLRHDASTAVAQVLLSLTLLAFHAYDALHAISLTLIRLVVTKRRLLEWETAASTAARAAGLVGSRGLRRFVVEMVWSPVIAVAVGSRWRSGGALPSAAAPFLPRGSPPRAGLPAQRSGGSARPSALPDERAGWLHRSHDVALLETFVTEADGRLAPDNQEGEGARARAPGAPHVADQHRDEPARRWPPTTSAPDHRPAVGTARRDAPQRVESPSFQDTLNWHETATRAPLYPICVHRGQRHRPPALALIQGLQLETQRRRCRSAEGGLDTARTVTALSSADPTPAARFRDQHPGSAIVAEAQGEVSDDRVATTHDTPELATAVAELDRLSRSVPDVAEVAYWSRAPLGSGRPHAPAGYRAWLVQSLTAGCTRGRHALDSLSPPHLRHRLSPGGRGRRRPVRRVRRPPRLGSAARELRAIAKGDVPQHHWSISDAWSPTWMATPR